MTDAQRAELDRHIASFDKKDREHSIPWDQLPGRASTTALTVPSVVFVPLHGLN